MAEGDVIVAKAVARGYMRYNGSNSMFNCYASTSSVIDLPSIYKLAGTGSGEPLIEAPVEYSIVVEEAVNGTVTASASTAFEGDVITLTVTPAEGYTLDALTVINTTTSEEVAVANNKFTMPASDVTVSATFKEKGTTPDPETIVFADLGLENGVQYLDPFDGGNFTVTFGGGANDGKYYNTGAAIRVYGGGTFTVSSTDHDIIKIDLTFGSGEGSNAITTNVGSFTSPTWTGSSKSVVFSVGGSSGHRRIASIKVTYGN